MATQDTEQQNIESESQMKELESKVEQLGKESKEYLESWKRERADFVNYKKNENQRIEEIAKYSCGGLLTEIVDVLDGLDMALANIPPNVSEQNKDWLEGLQSMARNMDSLLSKYGIEKIKVEGEKFNPALHEVVQVSEEGGENIVQVRAGYMLYDKVLRPARVTIVK